MDHTSPSTTDRSGAARNQPRAKTATNPDAACASWLAYGWGPMARMTPLRRDGRRRMHHAPYQQRPTLASTASSNIQAC